MPVFDDNVEMKYPNRSGGQSYVLPKNIYDKKGVGYKYDSGRILLLGDGGDFEKVDNNLSELSQNDNVQINIAVSKGYGITEVETDRARLFLNKFMQGSYDWHNVELTVVFKYLGGNDNGYITLGTRTGLGALDPCAGHSYKAGLRLNGSAGFLSKQQYFPDGNDYRAFNTTKMGTSLKNKYNAIKLVVYDLNEAGAPTLDLEESTAVKVELYGAYSTTSAISSSFRLL